MNILKLVNKYAGMNPAPIAYDYDGSRLSYKELDGRSTLLAKYLTEKYPDSKEPVVVFGHKAVTMPIAFFACMKAGRAYCPVDTSMPAERITQIIEAVDGACMIASEELPEGVNAGNGDVISAAQINEITSGSEGTEQTFELPGLAPEDTMYIIFTSGSTGRPKGVQISYESLNNYLDWMVTIGGDMDEKFGKRFLDQAPFSFDLSVMDTYTCFACGGTLCPIDKKTQGDYGKLFDTLRKIDPQIWVSTPSFADVCLADPSFNQEMMPSLELFEFCGERLTNVTASKLLDRFEHASVWNTYGPTESTVAMTGVEVTKKMTVETDPLPVGYVKPGTVVLIDPVSEEQKAAGTGEIIILGNTVSSGYYKNPEQTGKVFSRMTVDGVQMPAYRTGDEGYLKDGLLFYNGRIDLQVKLHGYRIEPGDIENNLMKIEDVDGAVVVPRMKDGKATSLNAFVRMRTGVPADRAAAKELTAALKEALRMSLPEYMVPKKFVYLDEIPMTVNGKADRKKLQEMLA